MNTDTLLSPSQSEPHSTLVLARSLHHVNQFPLAVHLPLALASSNPSLIVTVCSLSAMIVTVSCLIRPLITCNTQATASPTVAPTAAKMSTGQEEE